MTFFGKKEIISMKKTGMTRPIDSLGRVVIPMEIRENLGIETKDLLEISLQGDQIILKKSVTTCIFCGAEGELFEFEGKKLCTKCLDKLVNACK